MVRRSAFALTCLVLLLPLGFATPRDWRYRGVCYDADWEDRTFWYGTAESGKAIETLHRLGVNAISFTPFAYQETVDAPAIRFRPDLDTGMEADIREAQRRGMTVVLKPHIWSNQFWDGSGHWHGSIAMKTDADWEAWFQNYTRMIVHFAAIAERLKVDLFVVGIEYEKTTASHPEAWRKVIGEVRKVYRGRLSYGAHGFDEANAISFWDALDVIGINFYEPVADRPHPSMKDLLRAWDGHKRRLAALSRRKGGKPIVFLEAGYSSIDGTAQRPHAWATKGTAVDLDEQALCYSALFRALGNVPWLEGVFIWKYKIGVTPAEESREASESYFVFQKKPAEAVIRSAFGGKNASEEP